MQSVKQPRLLLHYQGYLGVAIRLSAKWIDIGQRMDDGVLSSL